MRAGHTTFAPLSTDFDDKFEFFSSGNQVFSLIEKFCNDHPFFTKRLANDLASASFNPLSDYYADRERARRLSQGATQRDIAGLITDIRQDLGI